MAGNNIGAGVAVGQQAHQSSNYMGTIWDAVSIVQQYSIADEQNQEIPENFFTVDSSFEFYVTGFKAVFTVLLASMLLIPFCVSVWLNQTTILGTAPLLYDKMLFTVMVLGMTSSIFYIEVWTSQYCKGKLTLLMVRNLYGGSMTAIFGAGLILSIVFSLLMFYSQSQFYNDYYQLFMQIGANPIKSKMLLEQFFSYHDIFTYSLTVMWLYFGLLFVMMLSTYIYCIKKVNNLQRVRKFINNEK